MTTFHLRTKDENGNTGTQPNLCGLISNDFNTTEVYLTEINLGLFTDPCSDCVRIFNTLPKELTEVQKAWIANLRANPEVQGTECLAKDGKFCCMGMAAELFNLMNSNDLLITEKDLYTHEIYYEDANEICPQRVQKWLGLRNQIGIITGTTSERNTVCLTSLNDSGKTFPEIADLIEENANVLFT